SAPQTPSSFDEKQTPADRPRKLRATISFSPNSQQAIRPRNEPTRDPEMDSSPPAHAASSSGPPWPADPPADKSPDPAPSPPPALQIVPPVARIARSRLFHSHLLMPPPPNRHSATVRLPSRRIFADSLRIAAPPADPPWPKNASTVSPVIWDA